MKKVDPKSYETVYDFRLPRGGVNVIRLDGVNFKKLTAKLDKPFDIIFSTVMKETTFEIAKMLPDCFYAYTFSDEMSFFLDDKNRDQYKSGRIQKIVSTMAGMATAKFQKIFVSLVFQYRETVEKNEIYNTEEIKKRIENLLEFINSNAYFDCRVFSVSGDEYVNVIDDRLNDAINNGITLMSSLYLNRKDVLGKSEKQVRAILFDAGHPWEKMNFDFKFGSGFQPIRNKKGKLEWVEQTILNKHAAALSKKTAIRESNEKYNNESES